MFVLLPGASSPTRGLRPVVRLRLALLTHSEKRSLTDPRNGDLLSCGWCTQGRSSRVSFAMQTQSLVRKTIPVPDLND